MYNINSFTAIDFETANPKRFSICQVGLVRVSNGVITDKVNLLIQPPDNYYWKNFIDIHGITPSKTTNAPTFDMIWHKIEPYIKDQDVVAHNISFDAGCLKHTLEYYDIYPPDYTKHCTCNIYGRRKLNDLCIQYKIKSN